MAQFEGNETHGSYSASVLRTSKAYIQAVPLSYRSRPVRNDQVKYDHRSLASLESINSPDLYVSQILLSVSSHVVYSDLVKDCIETCMG
jgi:hypothetical protein